MRVHELAKAVQLESKDVLAIAKRHRMTVKQSPSANVEDKDVRKLMPLIDKFKAELKAKEEQEKARKEEERKKKEEERRRKEEERRRETDEKRKAEEDERRRKEENERAAAQQNAEEERRKRDGEERQRREADAARKAEEERMRGLGLRVPVRPADYRPSAGAPADAPTPARTLQPAQRQETGFRPRVEGGQDKPAPGQAPQERTGPGSRPTQGRPEGRPGEQRRPEGGYRPGGETRRPEGGFRPGEGRKPEGGFRPGGDRRPETGYRQGGPGQQGQGGGYRQGGPGQQGQGGGYRQGGAPGQQGPGGGYRQGGPGQQGQGGGYRQGGPGQQGQGGGYRQGGPPGRPQEGGYRQGGAPGQQGRPPFARPGEQRGDRPVRPGGGQPGGRRDGGGGAPKLTEDNLPQIGVMRLDKHARGRDKDKDKKKAQPGEKRGKVAPRRIFELDEDMTVTTRPRIPGKTGARPAMRMGFGSRKRGPRPSGGFHSQGGGGGGTAVAPRIKQIKIDGEYTVGQFAEAIGIPATEMIKKLIMLGEMLNLNQQIGVDMMEVLAPEFGVELQIVRPKTDEDDIDPFMIQDNPEKMIRRSPVVTIMGHVDHGKTSLLDYVRKSKVVEGEFGGITQHIGAYHVTTSKGDIVFLDTPGHEAFTSMRARGASVTDLVILVVASNDGFKPQTIEAVHHAQAAKVPIVVAVNKIDLPGADPARVRQEALQHNLVPEDFGGDTIFVDISAKKGTNVDQLLEMVALQAEILDLKADPDRFAQGTIVESHVDPLRGAVATVLVQKGTLRAGDYFVTGDISGRVRAMVDDRGQTIKEAGPSFPVEIIGLTGSPPAGEVFLVMPDEKSARDVAERREARRRLAGLTPTQKHMTLEGLHERISEGVVKDLNLILKADVQGSIEAVSQSLEKLSTEQVRIRIIHTAVGGINDSDVNLAAASDAVIIGFNIRPEPSAAELAAQEGVEIKLYRIIYDLIEEVRGAMVGLLDPTYSERVIGHAEIRQVFRASKIGNIAGCTVRDGEITRDSKVRLVRDNVVIYEGKLASLKRVKEDAKKVTAGLECGILIENYNDVKEGDIIEAYQMEENEATL